MYVKWKFFSHGFWCTAFSLVILLVTGGVAKQSCNVLNSGMHLPVYLDFENKFIRLECDVGVPR